MGPPLRDERGLQTFARTEVVPFGIPSRSIPAVAFSVPIGLRLDAGRGFDSIAQRQRLRSHPVLRSLQFSQEVLSVP